MRKSVEYLLETQDICCIVSKMQIEKVITKEKQAQSKSICITSYKWWWWWFTSWQFK
jgi:hypothetical protein